MTHNIHVLVLSYNQGSEYGLVKNIFKSDSNLEYDFVSINPTNSDSITDLISLFLSDHSEDYCIITTNNIISSAQPSSNPTSLNYYLNLIISNNKTLNSPGRYEFDICYISKWLDNCFSYSNQFSLDDNGTTLVRTPGPQGFETLLFAPSGISIFLSRHQAPFSLSLNEYLLQDINANAIISVTFTQSPVVFDPLKATSVNDYAKTISCQNTPPITQSSDVSNLYFFYFILVILIIFIAAWLVFRFAPFINSSLDDYSLFSNPLAVRS